MRKRTVVTNVDWSGDDVVVKVCQSDEVLSCHASCVVLTLPLSVLQQKPPAPGAVHFHPPLVEKQHALDCLAMGSVVRLVLQFKTCFWEDGRIIKTTPLTDLQFLLTRDPLFPTFWTPMPLRLPLLTAWAAGPPAEAKRGQSHAHIEAEALTALSRVLSLPEEAVRGQLVRSFYHNWQNDLFSRGAYSYVLAGGMSAQKDLARPLGNRLFFAGEATQSDGHHATVHGAFASGYRAAAEVLQYLKT